jgi:hypothetical protein
LHLALQSICVYSLKIILHSPYGDGPKKEKIGNRKENLNLWNRKKERDHQRAPTNGLVGFFWKEHIFFLELKGVGVGSNFFIGVWIQHLWMLVVFRHCDMQLLEGIKMVPTQGGWSIQVKYHSIRSAASHVYGSSTTNCGVSDKRTRTGKKSKLIKWPLRKGQGWDRLSCPASLQIVKYHTVLETETYPNILEKGFSYYFSCFYSVRCVYELENGPSEEEIFVNSK